MFNNSLIKDFKTYINVLIIRFIYVIKNKKRN
jgi:hypothetical protein